MHLCCGVYAPFLCFVIILKIILIFFGYLVYLGIFRYDILWLTFVKYNKDMTECRIYLRVIHKASLLHVTYDPSYTCITKTCFPRFRKKNSLLARQSYENKFIVCSMNWPYKIKASSLWQTTQNDKCNIVCSGGYEIQKHD